LNIRKRHLRDTFLHKRVTAGSITTFMRGFRLWLRFVWTLAIAAGMGGCVRFQPQPLSPVQNADAFEERSLADAGLRAFLETNGVIAAWPRESWDLNALTLAALYYHPDMDLARARWHTAIAGKITAGQRPNPSLTFTPRLNSTAIDTAVTPWILGGVLDLPIETMGKRKYRMAQAQHLGEMGRFDLANTAWLVRSRVRQALLDLQTALETAALLHDQSETLGRVVELVESQRRAGEVSPVEVATARVAHHTAQLNLKDAQRQEADAHGALAEAIGVPVHTLEEVKFLFSDLGVFPTDLTAADLRRQALLNRADVLSALAEYAASESALQLQIAKQYPDIHLRPGYEMDQEKNKWSLGVSLDLPVLHQNQGPIAEAKAKREEIAAKFNSIQAKAIGEIDRATAVYFATVDQAAAAENILANSQKRSAAIGRMYDAGEVDKFAVTTAQAEALNGGLSRLKARVQAQKALAALETALQSPLSMPAKPGQLEAAARISDPPKKP
jgi:cobalt-zinc-cadmium efflux system outer membrane protein